MKNSYELFIAVFINKDYKLLKNHSIEPKQLLEPCQAPSKRPHEESGDFLTEILYSACSPTVRTVQCYTEPFQRSADYG